MPRISKYEALARLIEERMKDNLATVKAEEINILAPISNKDTYSSQVRRATTLKYGKRFRTKVVGEEVKITKI